MKKLIALLLALVCIVIAVSACKKDKDNGEGTTAAPEVTTEKPADVEPEVTYEDKEGDKYGEIHGVQG